MIYTVLGVSWIFFSDKMAAMISSTPEVITQIQIIKGWLYVLLTALLLYCLVSRGTKQLELSQEELLQAKEDWERTFDAVPDLILILDTDYRIVRANRAMAAKLGVPAGECAGLTCYHAFHGTSEPPSFCPHRQLLADGAEHTTEVHEDRLGGDFVVRVSPLLDPAGNFIGSVHVARDVTTRKQAERALRESKDQYDTLAANIPVGVYLLRTTPTGGFAFEYVSPRMANMLGLSAESILNDPQVAFQPIHPEESETFVRLNRERIEARQPFLWEGRVVVTGTIRWFQIESRPEPLDNGAVLWHGIVADITERKQAEVALRESQRQFADIIDFLPDATLVIDKKGKVIAWNHAIEDMTGISTAEMIGKDNFEYALPLRIMPKPKCEMPWGMIDDQAAAKWSQMLKG